MRNHILKVNAKVSLGDAYRYAELAVEACEKYPAVDPLLLLAIGVVESGYDPAAKSPADARGLYQIWPSTGRLLVRALGWSYDDATLYDPEKNTQAAALYLDMLFATYSDPQMVLAEYNGGPLNAGYFRAGVGALASETRSYVPKVMELHARLRRVREGLAGRGRGATGRRSRGQGAGREAGPGRPRGPGAARRRRGPGRRARPRSGVGRRPLRDARLQEAVHHVGVDQAEARVVEGPGQPAQDLEAELLPELHRRGVGGHHQVELHGLEAEASRLLQGMASHRLADAAAPKALAHRVGGVRDV